MFGEDFANKSSSAPPAVLYLTAACGFCWNVPRTLLFLSLSPAVLNKVPESHVVMMSFRLFDLEADPTCRYDYLDVYNGHSRLVQKLGRFCGTFRPGALISTSNTMMLEMVSDEATGGRGFLAYFSAGKPHMEGVDIPHTRRH